jgi:hypothetical protein
MKNPYDFVPFEGGNPKRDYESNGQEIFNRADAHSGHIACELQTETPLFIHGEGQQGEEQRAFYRRNGNFTIPATSIKGMIRSIAEVVSDSCMSVVAQEYDMLGNARLANNHFRTYRRNNISRQTFENMHARIDMKTRIPDGYNTCESREHLCLCCALFGMSESGDESDDTKSAIGSRVFFTDAKNVEIKENVPRMLPEPSGGPHPWHKLFYFDNRGNGQCLGRKFYYHHRDYQQTLDLSCRNARRTIFIDAIEGKFTFEVRFENLSCEELSTLLYSLELSRNFEDENEPGMRHHLGYAKPYGLGTAKITITSLKLETNEESGPARFLKYNLDNSHLIDKDSAWWRSMAEKAWGDPPRPNSAGSRTKLEQILAWPQRENFMYPDFNWFRGRTAGRITLEEYQRGVR